MKDETYKGILVLSIIALIVLFIGLNSQAQEDSIEHIHYIDSSMVYTADTTNPYYIFDIDTTIGWAVLNFGYNEFDGRYIIYETYEDLNIEAIVSFLTMVFGTPENFSNISYYWDSKILNVHVYLIIMPEKIGFEMYDLEIQNGKSQGNKKVDNDWNWNPKSDRWNHNSEYEIYHTLTFNGIRLNIKHSIEQCNENCNLYK